jgi:hypothetical protein
MRKLKISAVDVNSVLGMLHCVAVGDDDVSEVH